MFECVCVCGVCVCCVCVCVPLDKTPVWPEFTDELRLFSMPSDDILSFTTDHMTLDHLLCHLTTCCFSHVQ